MTSQVLDSALAIKVIEKLDEQAKFSQEQAKFSQEQAKFVAAELASQAKVLKFVVQELAEIKSEVIIIRGCVLSDFAGITQTTKEDIEAEAEQALEHKEVVLAAKNYFDPSHPRYRTPEFKAARKEIKDFCIGTAVMSYTGESVDKGVLVGCGQWVNAQLTKIFGEPVKGKYAAPIRPLVATLVGYYLAERVSNGRLF